MLVALCCCFSVFSFFISAASDSLFSRCLAAVLHSSQYYVVASSFAWKFIVYVCVRLWCVRNRSSPAISWFGTSFRVRIHYAITSLRIRLIGKWFSIRAQIDRIEIGGFIYSGLEWIKCVRRMCECVAQLRNGMKYRSPLSMRTAEQIDIEGMDTMLAVVAIILPFSRVSYVTHFSVMSWSRARTSHTHTHTRARTTPRRSEKNKHEMLLKFRHNEYV